MAADIFGQRIQRKICTMFDRPLEDRPEQRIVTCDDRRVALHLAEVVGDAADHRDIDESVGRICRGFDENHRNAPLSHRVVGRQLDSGFVDAVGKAHRADREARKRLREQRFRSAVERLRMQDHVARPREGENRGRNRRHAGREQRAGLRTLVDGEPVFHDFAVGMIEPRIDKARAHPLGRLAPTRNVVEEVLAVFGGPEHESRSQEHRWFDGAFRQLRIVAIIQHQCFGMQHVVADMGLRRKRFHHGLPRCLDSVGCSALGLPQSRCGLERWMRRYPTVPVNAANISVATSGTDFTEFEADPPDSQTSVFDICAFASFGLIMCP